MKICLGNARLTAELSLDLRRSKQIHCRLPSAARLPKQSFLETIDVKKSCSTPKLCSVLLGAHSCAPGRAGALAALD